MQRPNSLRCCTAPVTTVDNIGYVERKIRVRIKFYKIFEVDPLSNSFQIDFFLEASWEDDTIVHDDSTMDGREESSDEWEHQFPYKKGSKTSSQELRWTPRLNFRNLLEFTENSREDWYSVYSTTKDSNGATVQLPKVVVCYKMRGTAKFHMKFDMHSFPFDSQDLCINVYSCYQDVHSEKEKKRTLKQLSERSSLTAAARMYNITIEKNRSPTYKSIVPREDEFLLRDEYILSTEIAGISDVTDENKSAQGFKYPVLLLSVKLQRKPQYYFFNIILQMFVIVLLGFPCLLLDAASLTDRLSIVLTMLLSAMAYKAYTSEMIPKVSYLTWIEKYLISSTLLLTVLGVESALMYWLSLWDTGSCWTNRAESCVVAWSFEHGYSGGEGGDTMINGVCVPTTPCYFYSMEHYIGGALSLLWCVWHVWYGIRMTCPCCAAKTRSILEKKFHGENVYGKYIKK